MLVVAFAGWLVARAPARPAPRGLGAEEQLAGHTVALLGLGIVALLVVATNTFALLFLLPALHAWLWLPQVRTARLPVRLAVYAAGLCGIALLVLLVRVALRSRPRHALVRAHARLRRIRQDDAGARGAGGSRLRRAAAAAAAGRYAPYPGPEEQRPVRARAGASCAQARMRVRERRRRREPSCERATEPGS